MSADAPIRLEVQLPSGWLDLLSPTHSITWNRAPMDAGLLTAVILDARLDPSQADTLESGRPMRVLVHTVRGWEPAWTGKVHQAKVSYPKAGRSVPEGRRAQITVTGVDALQPYGTAVEPRSVATADELRTLLAASGLPWRVNGTTTPGPAQPLVVAYNDGSFLADQIVLTRDTLQGYAWVANDGVLDFITADHAAAQQPVAAFSDAARAPLSYSEIDVSYDSADVIDEVSVEFLRYKPVQGATEQITYGPYRRPGATGTNAKTFTIVGTEENEAAIEAFAQGVLDRNAVAQVRPVSLSTPVRSLDERSAAAELQPCALTSVAYDGRLDVLVRVDTVEHQIVANPEQRHHFPGGVQWTSTYTFTAPEAVARPQRMSIVTPAPIQERLEETELMAATASATAVTAQGAAAVAQSVATSAEDRATGMKAARPRTAVDGARAEMDSDASGGYFGIRDALNRFLGIWQIRVEDGVTRGSFGTGALDGADPVRFRFRSSPVERVIEALTETFRVFGVGYFNRLRLGQSPAQMTGFDGFDSVQRTTSSNGIVQVQHNLNTSGVRCQPFVGFTPLVMEPAPVGPEDVEMVLDGTEAGGIVRFRVIWRGGPNASRPQGVVGGDRVVNRTITFDWPIFGIQR